MDSSRPRRVARFLHLRLAEHLRWKAPPCLSSRPKRSVATEAEGPVFPCPVDHLPPHRYSANRPIEPWQGPGDVYYKIRKQAVAPRHFVESADMGTIAVRYVVTAVNGDRTRVRIDAVYVESSHHAIHVSDGNVEKMEMKEIKDRIDEAEAAAVEAEESARRKNSAEIVHQTYVRQREDETTRLNSAETSEKQLKEQVETVRHEIERRVKQPGADIKAAPFQSAASLKTVPGGAEILILIITPHWFGVETPQGQRGWIPVEKLEPLP